ncbi:MAG TPA: hypothetical protein VGH91_07065 [Gammaproteobacteria bacterium]|jgi:hypothetical protein
MDKQTAFDLRDISFDAFLDLIFDHPVAEKGKKEKEWYWHVPIDRRIEMDKAGVVERYVELFFRSDELLGRYSKDKLDQGCWFMMCSDLDFSACELIRDDELDIKLKERLIGSMYFLYEKLYSIEPLETSSYMWWDSFSRIPGLEDPTGRIQGAIFDTLVKILALDSEFCQGAALHGMGHLGHPDTERVIKVFMKKHPDLTEKQIDYCNNCITGDIL